MYKSIILRKIGSGYVIESEEIEKSKNFSVISVDIFRYEILIQIWNTTLLLLFFSTNCANRSNVIKTIQLYKSDRWHLKNAQPKTNFAVWEILNSFSTNSRKSKRDISI
jgi:hypothetical protein